MFLNLTYYEIHGLIAYARDKFAAERYPFTLALRPIREALAKPTRSRSLSRPRRRSPMCRA
jgi:hypothetical protein